MRDRFDVAVLPLDRDSAPLAALLTLIETTPPLASLPDVYGSSLSPNEVISSPAIISVSIGHFVLSRPQDAQARTYGSLGSLQFSRDRSPVNF
jgi:hypothetical protein